MLAVTAALLLAPHSARAYAGVGTGMAHVTAGNDGHYEDGGEHFEARVGAGYYVLPYLELGVLVSFVQPLWKSADTRALMPMAVATFVVNRDGDLALGVGVRYGAFFGWQQLQGFAPGGPYTYPPPKEHTTTYVGMSFALAADLRIRLHDRVQLMPYAELLIGSGKGETATSSFEPYLGGYLNNSVGLFALNLGIGAAATF